MNNANCCGKCRFCNYYPIASDASVCPRCSGCSPNPSLYTNFHVGVSFVCYAIMSVIFIGLVLLGIFATPVAFIYAIPFVGGIFGLVNTLIRPYG
jgi:hypothetical protein